MTKIYTVLQEQPGGVLMDAHHGVVRLWCLKPAHPAIVRALQRWFPFCESGQSGSMGIMRLGGYASLWDAVQELVAAKVRSKSSFIKQLHLVDFNEEGLQSVIREGSCCAGSRRPLVSPQSLTPLTETLSVKEEGCTE